MTNETPRYFGWLNDLPSLYDYTVEHPEIQPLLAKVNQNRMKAVGAPVPAASVDLRQWCSPIEDQKALGSCTANAGAGLAEYYMRRTFGKYINVSRLFLYKTTRDLLGWTGDTGAYLRSTMEAMVLFGLPPEQYWPYDISKFEVEPTAFLYSFASSYKALKYYRLDPPGASPTNLLNTIKSNLNNALPSMFGFTVFSSIAQATVAKKGAIPFPSAGEKVLGGHAIMAVGYNDTMKITNTNPGGPTTTGALLIRNSWGTGWGDYGYGWLPYEYVLRGLAVDWWSLISAAMVDISVFS
ncbi:MAG: C1 family peptidase [Cyanobacteriota bacterium]|nr:C1 family peptidase [Cyanobacteriota bacterium]